MVPWIFLTFSLAFGNSVTPSLDPNWTELLTKLTPPQGSCQTPQPSLVCVNARSLRGRAQDMSFASEPFLCGSRWTGRDRPIVNNAATPTISMSPQPQLIHRDENFITTANSLKATFADSCCHGLPDPTKTQCQDKVKAISFEWCTPTSTTCNRTEIAYFIAGANSQPDRIEFSPISDRDAEGNWYPIVSESTIRHELAHACLFIRGSVLSATNETAATEYLRTRYNCSPLTPVVQQFISSQLNNLVPTDAIQCLANLANRYATPENEISTLNIASNCPLRMLEEGIADAYGLLTQASESRPSGDLICATRGQPDGNHPAYTFVQACLLAGSQEYLDSVCPRSVAGPER